MYKKFNQIIISPRNLQNYVEGVDVYNSTLFYRLQDPYLTREDYEIDVYEYRPDLIAKDFYGSEDYQGIVIFQNHLPLTEYHKGKVLKLISRSVIETILDSL